MIYKRIKDLAKDKGISINALEYQLEMSRGSLCKIDINKPSAERLQKIADFFGVQTAYLLGKEEDGKSEDNIYYRAEQIVALYGYKIRGDESEGALWIEGNGSSFEVSDSDVKDLERNIGYALKIKLEELMNKNLRNDYIPETLAAHNDGLSADENKHNIAQVLKRKNELK